MQFIGGTWQPGKGGNFKSIDPMSGGVIWEGNFATTAQITRALKSASTAHEDWSARSLESRLEIIRHFYDLLETNKEALAQLITLETGKIFSDSASEVSATIAKLNNSLSAYNERTGTKVIDGKGFSSHLSHASQGVLSVIGPFNFPLHLPNGHITPALLAGNTVIYKPSESTPLVAEYTMVLWDEAGLPPGVINLIHGNKNAVKMLCKNPLNQGILFTGSHKAGKSIMKTMSDFPEKILALELGGNNPIVAWSTRKINSTVEIIFESAFISSGQRCTCARRLILPKTKVGLQILIGLKKKIKTLSFAKSQNLMYGSLISPKATDNFLKVQEMLLSHGAKSIVKSKKLKIHFNLVTPALLDVTNLKKPYDDENFGPMLQVQFVDSFEEAIKAANATKYGLAASLFSEHRELFDIFQQKVRAGGINFNATTTGASGALPFGGIGASGNLRPAGFYAADYCAWPKASIIKEL